MRIDQFISGEAVCQLVDALLLVGSDGSIQDANSAALEAYGYTLPEIRALNVADLRVPDGVAFTALWDSGHSEHPFEEVHARRDGTTFPAEVHIAHVSTDGENALLAYVQDITDRRLAEESLRESEAKHSAMISNISDVIGIMGIDGFMKYKSPNITRWFGWQPEDLIGTDGWLTVHPADIERLKAEFAALVQGEDNASTTVEYRYLCKDGGYCWIELTATNLIADPVIQGVLLNYRDISERKKMERLGRELNSVIDVIGNVSEMLDPYTAGHQRRVSELASAIAQDMGMDESDIDDIRVAGLLHDIGKMSVPVEILTQPRILSPAEYRLVKGHSQAGYKIISSAKMPEPIAELVYQHHERCDGSGYPRGLAQSEILDGSRILMVADVVEAMTSHRPYRPALGTEAALSEIEQGAGKLYDAEASKSCVRVFRERDFAFSEF